LGSRSTAPPGTALGSYPTNNASQGLGTRRQALGHRCPGAPWRHSLSVPLPTPPLTGSRPRCDIRRQSFSRPLGARGLPGPRVNAWSRSLSPPRILQKVSPVGGQSKPTPSDTQSVRTELPDHTQASLAQRHLDGPWRTAARPSWTSSHVYHRLEPPNRHVPDLSYYIRDKVRPRRGEDPDSITRHSIPFHMPPLCTESKATQRVAPRAPPPPHLIVSFLSDEEETPPAARQP
jgi:hypothetical protein